MDEQGTVQCVLCGHRFQPGAVEGYIYCSACGRRFNPDLAAEETVIASGPTGGPAPEVTDEDRTETDNGASASRRFGDYDIINEIARGGMGVVYLARQRVLRRIVALKVLRSGDNASDEERERLLREAKAAAGLSHPNIVPIHEFSSHQGQPYFTMDYIDGQPLDMLLETGPLKVRHATAIIATVSRAISYAHVRGIIHRDLKPANIILTPDGRPMITDFGLAVERSQESEKKRRMTMDGAVMGTIPYAPPEQAAGKIDLVSERSDVYSMGAVFYEMVTGRPPFSGFTQFELMRRVINNDPVPPRQLNPKVHRDVETIILKCLEKEQRRRYATAKDFADDCDSFLKGEVISARPATALYRCRRFLTRRPLLNLLGAMVICLSLAVWMGVDLVNAMAREKEATEQERKVTERERMVTEQKLEETIAAKQETEKQLYREWRTEYNINFDPYFRWVTDVEASHRQGLPWLSPESTQKQTPARVMLLTDPPRLALIDPSGHGAGPETPFSGDVDLGLPFSFPREVKVTLRIQTPAERVGELILSLDVNKEYKRHLGTTTIRFGSPAHPGAHFYRSDTIIGEDPTFSLKPGTSVELSIERTGNKLRAFIDNRQILEADDPPPVYNADAGRISVNVKDGSLELRDLSVDLRGMSQNLASSLIETANNMAARGRAEQALPLYLSVLIEPTDPQNHLRAMRGYARSLWLGLPRRERGLEGIEKACRSLSGQLASAGRADAGMIDYLVALALSSGQPDDTATILKYLRKAETVGHSSDNANNTQYGDLARLEIFFVTLRRNLPNEAARLFVTMYENGTTGRLYERFGAELAGGGQVALILERVSALIDGNEELETAATLLRAAAAISPSSRECASHFRRLGNVHAGRNEPDQAIDLMHWAERISPDWTRPYLDEARIHFENGHIGNAEDALERALNAIPQSLDLQIGIARLYLEDLPAARQNPAKAEQAARAAATLSQNANPAAMELLANALFRQKRYAEAGDAIEAALKVEANAARQSLRDRIAANLPKQ